MPLPSWTAAGTLYMTLSWPKPTTVSSSRAPYSPVPQSARQRKRAHPLIPRIREEKRKGLQPRRPRAALLPFIPRARPHPSILRRPPLHSHTADPRVDVSLRKASTASVDFSFHNHLPEGALGCFHSWTFPISFHSRLICGIQALHSVKRWWRVCCLPPPHHQHRSSSVLWILSFR